ncbi:hypothetical protein JCM21900_001602, partial [Sporobolomyces salmonicolor]
LFAELESEQALEVYADHPVHEAYKAKTKPFTTDVLAFDIETP